MAKQTKRFIQFIGFILSVWIFGKGANAAVIPRDADISASSRNDIIKSLDSAKFAQTGDVAQRDNRANMFAYVCSGVYCSDQPWQKNCNCDPDKDTCEPRPFDENHIKFEEMPKDKYNSLKPSESCDRTSFGIRYWYPC
jgi:hypothetical protein